MSRFFFFVAIWLGAVVLFILLAAQGGRRAPGGQKILRLALDEEPKSLDPIAITDAVSDGVAHKIHSMLMRFEKVQGELVPVTDLAEKCAVSPDGKFYTFSLRRGVMFHNGREMLAEDVVYSLSRLLTPESKRPEWLKPFVAGSEERYKDPAAPLGIKAVDKYTVTIELIAPFAPFLQHLCTSNCAIVPREAVEDASRPFARNPVGVGAFKLEEWRYNEALSFARHDGYFKGRPKLDKIIFRVIKEPAIRLANFLAGALDASDIPYGSVKRALELAGEENVFHHNTFRTNYVGIGFPNGPFKDDEDLKPWGTNKLLRQALSYAIDREHLCRNVLEGRGIPAKGILPPGLPGYKEGRPGWPKDTQKARALLAQAGYPGGQGLKPVTLLYYNNENQRKIAQDIAYDLEEIGLNIVLQVREKNSFFEVVEKKPQPMFLLGWVADYPDPDNFLYVLFNSQQWGAPGNHTWYANAEVDRLTEKARGLQALQDRLPLYQKSEDIILDDSPWLCTYHVLDLVLLRKEVTGLRENITPLDTGTEFPQVDFAFVDIVRK